MPSTIETASETIRYIEANLSQRLDLEKVSAALHYSKFHLHRMFADTVKLTIHAYILRRRLTEAAKALAFTNAPILQIALLTGYESQQAFSAIFQTMYKQSPGRFRTRGIYYPLQLEYVLNPHPAAYSPQISLKNKMRAAVPSDHSACMKLVHSVIDGFPCLVEDEYRRSLDNCIDANQAFLVEDEDLAIGILLWNPIARHIDFLGLHPQYDRVGIARTLLFQVTDALTADEELSITTFREGDRADTGHRNLLKALGFEARERLIEFDYPTQKLILKKEWRSDNCHV